MGVGQDLDPGRAGRYEAPRQESVELQRSREKVCFVCLFVSLETKQGRGAAAVAGRASA